MRAGEDCGEVEGEADEPLPGAFLREVGAAAPGSFLLLQAPEGPAQLLERGLEQLGGGDLAGSLDTFTTCLAVLRSQDDGAAQQVLVDVPDLPAMLSRDYAICECLLRIAHIHLQDGRWEAAKASLRRALAAFPESTPGQLSLATILGMESASSSAGEVERLLVSAAQPTPPVVDGTVPSSGGGRGRGGPIRGGGPSPSSSETASASSAGGGAGFLAPVLLASERDSEARREARSRLALLWYQTGKTSRADALVRSMGYRLRLRDAILIHDDPQPDTKLLDKARIEKMDTHYTIIDDALPSEMLQSMLRVFVSEQDAGIPVQIRNGRAPATPFWREHRYREIHGEYFSYAHKLEDKPTNGLDVVIQHLWRIAQKHHPESRDAKFAEWWAHRRPHSSGHQCHYDSENEGKGEVHHPIASSVLYLSESVGGPTLITDQIRGQGIAENGVMAFPKLNRLVIFDGKVLHGVIPGVGVKEDGARRVTFMCAFWDRLNVRPRAETPGAAQMMPLTNCKHYSWHRGFLRINKDDKGNPDFGLGKKVCGGRPEGLTRLAKVWEFVHQGSSYRSNAKKETNLSYEDCFQGF